MKSNEDFRNALGQPDEYFEQAVLETLDQLNRQDKKESRPQRNYIPRIACTFAALVLVIAGAVLSARHLDGGHVDAVRPTPAAAPAAAPADLPEVFSSMETDLATITLLTAETDGYGIFLTFEITPKRENVLIIDGNSIDPVYYGPESIGLTPDRDGQNIVQWAAGHDCEILDIQICSALREPTCEANCYSYIESPALGAPVIMNVDGCCLPDVSLYRMYCRYCTWDLSNPEIYEEPSVSVDDDYIIIGRFRNPAVGSFITVSVTGEKETPEILAEYRLDSEKIADADAPDISATCFRTSRAEYLDICTGFKGDNIYAVYPTYDGTGAFFSYDSGDYVHGYVRQEDGTIHIRDTVRITGEFTDSFTIGFMPYYYDNDTREWGPGYPMKLGAALPGGAAFAEKTEVRNLGGYGMNFLSYEDTLPDGRILLAGYQLDLHGIVTARLLCLNSDGTVSWDCTDDSGKDGIYTVAAVLPDGTIGAVLHTQKKADMALRFFTQDGEATGKTIAFQDTKADSVLLVNGGFQAATESRLLAHVLTSSIYKPNVLADWDGEMIAEVDAKGDETVSTPIAIGMIEEPDGLMMYGWDFYGNQHGVIWKTDMQGKLLWKTVLPDIRSDELDGTLLTVFKTEDGGYLGVLEQTPVDVPVTEKYDHIYALVKVDSTGKMLWMNREIFGDITLMSEGFGQYGGKYAAVFVDYDNRDESSRLENPRTIRWFDENGTKLGTAELNMKMEDFDWLADHVQEFADNGQFAAVIPQRKILALQDGLWMLASVEIQSKGDDPEPLGSRVSDPNYSREVLIRIPEP